jgi:hypothetical protein
MQRETQFSIGFAFHMRNLAPQLIHVQVLLTSASLASAMGLPDLAAAWTQNATALKTNFNDAFWVEELGMYRDNVTTTLTPQDANSFAVLFNITTSAAQAASISAGLEKNWNDLGPVAPELPDTISPFISGFEVCAGFQQNNGMTSDVLSAIQLQAHFVAGNASRAMDLLHREWGYMLYTNLSVESTLLEGFTANGSIWCAPRSSPCLSLYPQHHLQVPLISRVQLRPRLYKAIILLARVIFAEFDLATHTDGPPDPHLR